MANLDIHHILFTTPLLSLARKSCKTCAMANRVCCYRTHPKDSEGNVCLFTERRYPQSCSSSCPKSCPWSCGGRGVPPGSVRGAVPSPVPGPVSWGTHNPVSGPVASPDPWPGQVVLPSKERGYLPSKIGVPPTLTGFATGGMPLAVTQEDFLVSEI